MNPATTSILCIPCQHLNLPGGVRCAYCGTHFPPILDFDMGEIDDSLQPLQQVSPLLAGTALKQPAKQGRAVGALGSLAVLAMKGKSLFALFKVGKIALTLSTMLLSMVAYAQIYQWRFAVGFVICILIHELGHVFVNWRKGIPATAPMFIPFMGAVIFVKGFPNNPTVESECGMGGPFAGMLAALVCLVIALITRDPLWMALANTGFFLNLFNLLPFPPLDGSHIGSVFSPKMWSGALIIMLLWVLKVPSAMLWPILIVGFLLRLGRADDGRYLLASPRVRIRMAALYVLLAIGLSYGCEHTVRSRPYRSGFLKSTARSSSQVPASTPSASQNEISITGSSGTPAAVSSASATTNASLPSISSSSSSVSDPSISSRRPTRSRLSASELAALTRLMTKYIPLFLLVLSGGLWIITAFLLRSAAKAPLSTRLLVLPGLMLALLIMLACADMSTVTEAMAGEAQYAYSAAALAAIFYAGYQAYHLQKRQQRPRHLAIITRCMAWACAGALLVAYITNSVYVALGVVVLTGVYYMLYPWMLPSMASGMAESMGEHARALTLLDKAIALKPERDSLADLWRRVVNINVLLDHGGKALEALDLRAAILRTGAGNAAVSPGAASDFVDLEARSVALMLLEEFDEALVCCEQMLQADVGTAAAPLRLLAVHMRLGKIAYYRGWYDEALAQSNIIIPAVKNRGNALLARLLLSRAATQVAVRNNEAAQKDCAQALEVNQEPYILARAAVTRAQVCLQTGDIAGADRETLAALRHLPDCLQFRYWRGRVLLALGRIEGREMLDALASEYPDEYWGHKAALPVVP